MEAIESANVNQVMKEIQRLKKDKKQIIVKANSLEFNRKIVEINDVNILLDPHFHNRKDRMKQRDSGLNEILCKLAKKNNIKIGINIRKIQKLKGKNKAIVLARIIQNINLAKKTKTEIVVFPKINNSRDVMSFFIVLGASTSQAKEALSS